MRHGFRLCSCCGVDQEADEQFTKSANMPDGVRAHCKTCCKAQARARGLSRGKETGTSGPVRGMMGSGGVEVGWGLERGLRSRLGSGMREGKELLLLIAYDSLHPEAVRAAAAVVRAAAAAVVVAAHVGARF